MLLIKNRIWLNFTNKKWGDFVQDTYALPFPRISKNFDDVTDYQKFLF